MDYPEYKSNILLKKYAKVAKTFGIETFSIYNKRPDPFTINATSKKKTNGLFIIATKQPTTACPFKKKTNGLFIIACNNPQQPPVLPKKKTNGLFIIATKQPTTACPFKKYVKTDTFFSLCQGFFEGLMVGRKMKTIERYKNSFPI